VSLECRECERDLRGGHDKGCSRYVKPCCKRHDEDGGCPIHIAKAGARRKWPKCEPEVRYDEQERLDEVVVDGRDVQFIHLEYMNDDSVWMRIDLKRGRTVTTTRWFLQRGKQRQQRVLESAEAIVVNLWTGRDGRKGARIHGRAERD